MLRRRLPLLLAALPLGSLAAQTSVRMEFDTRIRMRDGVELSADVYRPDRPGKFPVILVRTPYDNGTAPNLQAGKRWAARGYVYVVQDVRGRGDSDGQFYPLVTEGKDGFDTIAWLAAQPWSNGKVGMLGGSYLGWVQLYAAAEKPPALAALIPTVTPTDPDKSWPMQYGAYSPATISWLANISGHTSQDLSELDLWGAYAHRPLRTADRYVGRSIKSWQDWLDHPASDEYWDRQSYQDKILDSQIPMLHVSGWYDDVLLGTLQNFARLTGAKADPAVRSRQRLLIGPWGHRINQSSRMGDVDFGPTALIDLEALQARWFDRWLRGTSNGIEQDPSVRIFVMGENAWRDEHEWPLARTKWTKFYLHSTGKANSRYGDGTLDTLPPAAEPPDHYRYDPATPVPLITDAHFSQVGGPDDYQAVERRDDMLVYTTAPFDRPTEMCGPLSATIHAASSAKDTDWLTKVLIVYPNGVAQRLNDGGVRARYAKNPRQAQLVTPGQVESYAIDNWGTCILFRPGERLRLEVASSSFPKFDANLNTGGSIADDTVGVVANQTIFHDRARPSYLLVPLIPR
ncbi:MAG: CocE/NonD family hydrolase [Gemmatimonadaceae bacterium]